MKFFFKVNSHTKHMYKYVEKFAKCIWKFPQSTTNSSKMLQKSKNTVETERKDIEWNETRAHLCLFQMHYFCLCTLGIFSSFFSRSFFRCHFDVMASKKVYMCIIFITLYVFEFTLKLSILAHSAPQYMYEIT